MGKKKITKLMEGTCHPNPPTLAPTGLPNSYVSTAWVSFNLLILNICKQMMAN